MPIDEVLNKYNIKRILGIPGQAVAKREYACWTLPDDAQVETSDGIRPVPGGTVVLEFAPNEYTVFSITEFNELYEITGVREDDDEGEEVTAAGEEGEGRIDHEVNDENDGDDDETDISIRND